MSHIAPPLVTSIVKTDKIHGEDIFDQIGKVYTFLNPVSYLDALDNIGLFDSFDGIFADGSILVSAIKALYGEKVVRRSFDMTSMAPALFEYAERNGKSVYIVASKQEEIDKAVGVLQHSYPEMNIVGYRNGYFSGNEQEIEVRHIVGLEPDFLIVGMGSLAQERFLLMVKNAGFKGIGFTCGGFIHQTTSCQIEYYPPFFNKLNIRFLYRMYKEKHTRIRYLKAAFVFPVRFLIERIR